MQPRTTVNPREVKRSGLISRGFRGLIQFASMLVIALVFSLVLECAGMTFLWPEEGVRHSEQMLVRELRYLNNDFERSIVGIPPWVLAQRLVERASYLLEWAGLDTLMSWIETPSQAPTTWQQMLKAALRHVRSCLEAATNVVKTFSVRLVVLAFSMPAFVLFGVVGFADGLMRRDLRRWGGGRESSFLYHHSKKLLAPSIITAWMLYLAMPFSVHPNLVLLPFAGLFATGVAVTMATFKKYL